MILMWKLNVSSLIERMRDISPFLRKCLRDLKCTNSLPAPHYFVQLEPSLFERCSEWPQRNVPSWKHGRRSLSAWLLSQDIPPVPMWSTSGTYKLFRLVFCSITRDHRGIYAKMTRQTRSVLPYNKTNHTDSSKKEMSAKRLRQFFVKTYILQTRHLFGSKS